MTTQTYRKPTKAMRTHQLISRLEALGFTTEEAYQLRRIQMTLHRWAELECGNSNDVRSWHIERDETTDRPFFVNHWHRMDKISRQPIPDREKGALKRLEKIVFNRNNREWCLNGADGNHVQAYHQTDPRGCALYLVKVSDIREGETLDSVYNRGLAVCD